MQKCTLNPFSHSHIFLLLGDVQLREANLGKAHLYNGSIVVSGLHKEEVSHQISQIVSTAQTKWAAAIVMVTKAWWFFSASKMCEALTSEHSEYWDDISIETPIWRTKSNNAQQNIYLIITLLFLSSTFTRVSQLCAFSFVEMPCTIVCPIWPSAACPIAQDFEQLKICLFIVASRGQHQWKFDLAVC